jgi:hypothetical protein
LEIKTLGNAARAVDKRMIDLVDVI